MKQENGVDKENYIVNDITKQENDVEHENAVDRENDTKQLNDVEQ